MFNSIRLNSGRSFNYETFDSIDICVEDIATSLSRLNRYLGHTVRPYSVAEHSWHMAHHFMSDSRGLGVEKAARLALLALVHDAHEMVVGDMPTPLKAFLGPEALVPLRQIEEKFDQAMYEALGIAAPTDVEKCIIKQADTLIRNNEKTFLFGIHYKEQLASVIIHSRSREPDYWALVWMGLYEELMELKGHSASNEAGV